jgi:hypothetical protein
MIVSMGPGMFRVLPLAFHFSLVVLSHLTGKGVWNSGRHSGSVISNEVVFLSDTWYDPSAVSILSQVVCGLIPRDMKGSSEISALFTKHNEQ